MPRIGLILTMVMLLPTAAPAARPHPSANPPSQTGIFDQIKQKDARLASRYPKLVKADSSELGAVGDGWELTDGATTSGSTLFTSAVGKFLPGDVGKVIFIQGAGNSGDGNWLNTTIAGYQSPTTITLSGPALYTTAGALFDYGTDNAPLINAFEQADNPINPNVINTPHTGRQLYLPGGMYLLSTTIYIRKGDVLEGDGGTATELRSFDPNPNDAILKLGGNAVTGLDTGGLDAGVVGVYFSKAEGEATAIDTLGGAGWDTRYCWFQVAVGVLATGTDGIISENTFDSSTARGIIVRGNGQSYNPTHSILITTNRFAVQRWAAIELDGAVNTNIINNYFNYSYSMSIYTDPQKLNYRIIINGNQFNASLDPAYSSPHQKHIYLGGPLCDSTISSNVFEDSIEADIHLDYQWSCGLQITGNTSREAQGNFITATSAGPGVVITNNRIISPGYYAGDFGVAVDLESNFCSNPFAFSSLPQNDIDRSCFRFAAGVSGITARGNITDSDEVSAVSLHAGSSLNVLSGNQSNWSLGAVYIGPGTGRISSTEETIYDDGGAGTVLTMMTDSSSGDMSFAGTLTAGSSQIQVTDGSGHLLASALTGLYLGTVTVPGPGRPVTRLGVNPPPKHCWASSINGRARLFGVLPYVEIQGNNVLLHALVPAGAQFDIFCVFN